VLDKLEPRGTINMIEDLTGYDPSCTSCEIVVGETDNVAAAPRVLPTVRNRENMMTRSVTLEYWEDEGWYVGRLREVPGVFSQGETIEELRENMADAYRMMCGSSEPAHARAKTTEVRVDV
jgi:predicted RNase H-like HicB family nuclease